MVYLVTCRALKLLVPSSTSPAMEDKVETLVLRHQLEVLQRQVKGRPRYRPAGRALLVALSRVLPRTRWRAFLVKPETLYVLFAIEVKSRVVHFLGVRRGRADRAGGEADARRREEGRERGPGGGRGGRVTAVPGDKGEALVALDDAEPARRCLPPGTTALRSHRRSAYPVS